MDGWKEVENHKRFSTIINKIGEGNGIGVRSGTNRSTTFFFTSNMDDYISKKTYGVFMQFGGINEVIISDKLDKNKRRYNFV